MESQIRLGIARHDWVFKNGAIGPDFPAAAIFRFGGDFRGEIRGGRDQNAAAEADCWGEIKSPGKHKKLKKKPIAARNFPVSQKWRISGR